MTTKQKKKQNSLPNAQLSENLTSDSLTPSSDYRDIDTLSDAGTYVIDDDLDIAQDDKLEQKSKPSSSFKRYANPTKNRHGTFDIHGLITSTAHTISRPVVDSNTATHNLPASSLSNSSSLSSLLSFADENDQNKNNSSNNLSHLQQPSTAPVQNQIKPAEFFVISPAHESKSFPTTNPSRQKADVPSQPKLTAKSARTKDPNLEVPTEKYSFHLQKQSPSTKAPIRPHSSINDPTYSSSTFQRNSTARQIIPGSSQYQRPTSTSSIITNDDTTSNATKVPTNKSFILRQQRSNLSSSTSKVSKPSLRQPLKATQLTSSSSITNSNGQMNRAVELRRARAQAKIEELSQRTKKLSNKTDIMSASWHSSASKKDVPNLRSKAKPNIEQHRRDMFETQTISSSSTSLNPLGEKVSMISSVTDEPNSRMSASTLGIEGEQSDSLRNNGQRLVIKLIQLSSGILEKLKPNDGGIDDGISVRELKQLVDKLQMINRTLSSIDASLTGPTNDDAFA